MLFGTTSPVSAKTSVDQVGGFSYVQHSVQVAPKHSRTARARCPAGTHVLSGGARATEYRFLRLQGLPFDSEDKRKSPDDGWEARVWNRNNSSVGITVSAVCSRLTPRYVELKDEWDEIGASEMRCRNSERATAGGFATGPGRFKTRDFPSQQGWIVGGWTSASRAKVIRLSVVCLDSSVTVSGRAGTAPGNELIHRRMGCDGRDVAIGGGIDVGSTFGAWMIRGQFTEPDQFHFLVEKFSRSDGPYTAYVVCHRRIR